MSKLILSLAICAALHQANASTLISSNFLPGDAYGPGGQTIGSYNFCPGHSLFCRVEMAMPFTPAANYAFDYFRVAAAHAFGIDASKGNELTVYLAEGTSEPGPPIESYTFVSLPDFPVQQVVTGISALHSPLLAGNRYWIVVTTGDLDANAMVWYAGASAPQVYLRSTGYPDWTAFTPSQMQPTAFDVYGTLADAPEPGSFSMILLGVVAVVAAARRTSSRAG